MQHQGTEISEDGSLHYGQYGTEDGQEKGARRCGPSGSVAFGCIHAGPGGYGPIRRKSD